MILLLLLFGFCEMEIEPALAGAFFECCRAGGWQPRRVKKTRTGQVCCVFFARQAGRVLEAARQSGLPLYRKRYGGLPYLGYRILKRPGMILGLSLALTLILASRMFLFGVEITGNEAIGADELRRELSACGLRLGGFLPKLDTDAVASALRQGDQRIAYVAINLQGTVAKVQIREAKEGEDKKTAKLPANLVALYDGVVTAPLVYEGKCLVREGDVVRKGQLLASGLLDTDNNGLRVTRAAGEIFARTVHTYTVHVPFLYEKRVYTGEEKSEISLLFFSLDRKVLKTTGKMTERCDIIEETRWLSVGGKALPLGWVRARYLAYELIEARYTVEEAYAHAQEELSELLYEESATRRVLSRRIETVADAEGVTLICTVVAEENIATTVEFSIEP